MSFHGYDAWKCTDPHEGSRYEAPELEADVAEPLTWEAALDGVHFVAVTDRGDYTMRVHADGKACVWCSRAVRYVPADRDAYGVRIYFDSREEAEQAAAQDYECAGLSAQLKGT